MPWGDPVDKLVHFRVESTGYALTPAPPQPPSSESPANNRVLALPACVLFKESLVHQTVWRPLIWLILHHSPVVT